MNSALNLSQNSKSIPSVFSRFHLVGKFLQFLGTYAEKFVLSVEYLLLSNSRNRENFHVSDLLLF
jgi:hypothetical protein